MPTPIVDPTFQPGCYVFGYTIPGLGYFGNRRTYPQQAIFGIRPFGTEIPGKNTENDVFQFIYGSKNLKTPYRKDSSWVTSTTPWPVTSDMSARCRGNWAKRVIFFTRNGRQVIRRYTPYDGSPKNNLVPWAVRLTDGVALWHLRDLGTRRILNAEASRLGLKMSGYNYFLRLYIKDNPKWGTYV